MLYSVEQLPRCDLLRLSPWLGDSSCRLDETPSPACLLCDGSGIRREIRRDMREKNSSAQKTSDVVLCGRVFSNRVLLERARAQNVVLMKECKIDLV